MRASGNNWLWTLEENVGVANNRHKAGDPTFMFAEVTDDPLGDFDDADEDLYEERRKKVQRLEQSTAAAASQAAEAGGDVAEPDEGDVVFDGGFRLSNSIYNKLFDYQKTGGMQRGTSLFTVSMLFSATSELLQPAAPGCCLSLKGQRPPSFWSYFGCTGGCSCNCLR